MTIGNLCSRPDGRRTSCRGPVTLLVAALAFGCPAAGQEPDALSSSEVAFGEEVDVRVANVDVLARVSRDTSDYYWLGFVPEYRRDDRVHDIEVEVLRPGLEVRARRGYLDLSRSAEADMEAQPTLLFPGQKAPAAAVLEARVGDPRKLSRRRMAVPIDIEVPLGIFPALPYGNEYLQRLEIRFATIDGAGWRAEQPAIPLEVRSHSAPQPDSVFDYYAEVTLRHLPRTVVITVHDPVSRQTASVRVEVAP